MATLRDFLQKLGGAEPVGAFFRKNIRGSVGEGFGKIDVGQKSLSRLGSVDQPVREGQLRRLGHAASGGVGGAIRGGPIGAALGGIYGYQDKRPLTGRRLGQKALAGLAIGQGVSSISSLGGAGSSAGSSVAEAGSSGAGTSLDLYGGTSGQTALDASLSGAGESSGAGGGIAQYLKLARAGGGGGQDGGQQQSEEERYYQETLKRIRERQRNQSQSLYRY